MDCREIEKPIKYCTPTTKQIVSECLSLVLVHKEIVLDRRLLNGLLFPMCKYSLR